MLHPYVNLATQGHSTLTVVNRYTYVKLNSWGYRDTSGFLCMTVPVHAAVTVMRFLVNRSMVITHPPYSPDQAPADIFLFPK
jgi:hypothetical protein